MQPIALKWKSNFVQGHKLFHEGNTSSFEKALELFTLSARSFPDSWLARTVHGYRAKIFEQLGKYKKQQIEQDRIEEYYIPLQRNEAYVKKILGRKTQ